MKKPSKFLAGLFAAWVVLALVLPMSGQNPPEEGQVWNAFAAWLKTNPKDTTLKAYGEKLAKDGLPAAEVERRLGTIRKIFTEQPEKGIEITYDRIFSQPLTGDPNKDGFTSTPSVFMVESTKKLKPGKALDVGAGQGRNAVWLAQQGWDVTGIDISGAGLAAATANAEKAGVRISTVKTTYEDFAFGAEQWDLIVMILSWAPVADPAFVARLNAALRPGGVLVFEHVLETPKQQFPKVVRALPPNALLKHFSGIFIQYYEEGVWQGDWGGPPAELVRMIARKMSQNDLPVSVTRAAGRRAPVR
jgi:2-polyprenyl-3-methyl-5-hydroxy-6-metoxy-1,4-benzoquinol methylase